MTMSALTVEEKNDTYIKHALKVRSAWSLSNYHCFFQLYSTAPNMGGYLLDMFVQRERERAIRILIKSWVISFVVVPFSLCVIFLSQPCIQTSNEPCAQASGFHRFGGRPHLTDKIRVLPILLFFFSLHPLPDPASPYTTPVISVCVL